MRYLGPLVPSTRSLFLVLVGVLGFAMSAAGCSGGNCSEAGCESGVHFEVRGVPLGDSPLFVRACADDTCRDLKRAGAEQLSIFVPKAVEPGEPIKQAVIEVTDSAGAVVVSAAFEGSAEPSSTRPNGRRCPPTCHLVNLSTSAGSSTLRAAG